MARRRTHHSRYRIAVMAQVAAVRIRVDWSCPKCSARLVTYTRLVEPPTHRCGSKRQPVPFTADDETLAQKALQ